MLIKFKDKTTYDVHSHMLPGIELNPRTCILSGKLYSNRVAYIQDMDADTYRKYVEQQLLEQRVLKRLQELHDAEKET